ncbi:MAG TPA: zinc-binding dehydrogenase [Acidothermaceae bacterium]
MSSGLTMLAAVMPAAGRIEVDEFPIPKPGEHEALVRMHTAAICGSDIHVLYDGFAREDAFGRPGYPGHEGVGEIVESNSTHYIQGMRVLTVPPGWYGGCFAEYQVVHERWLLPLPDGDDEQRQLMAQQLGTTIFGMRHFWTGAGGGVAAVIGAGSAGLFFLQQLVNIGFEKVVVSDLEPTRLEIARSLGAFDVVDGGSASIVEATLAASDNNGADLVIEAVGLDHTRELAIECVRKWGRVGFFGYPERYGPAPFPTERAFRKAVQINFMVDTAFEPGLRSFAEAIEVVHNGTIDVDYLLNERFSLEEINAAFEHAHGRRRGSVKIRVDLHRRSS